MFVRTLLSAALLALPLPVASHAATIFASEVTTFLGPQSTGDRRVGKNALGQADGKFLSLGFGGVAVFEFGRGFTGPASILEVTWGKREGYLEAARIYVGNIFDPKSKVFDPSAFTRVGEIDNREPASDVDFAGTWTFLAIEDISPRVKGRDGFDIDSVSVSTLPSAARLAPVPLPASGLLLLAGLATFVRMRRVRAG